jgi:hypothetical protein
MRVVPIPAIGGMGDWMEIPAPQAVRPNEVLKALVGDLQAVGLVDHPPCPGSPCPEILDKSIRTCVRCGATCCANHSLFAEPQPGGKPVCAFEAAAECHQRVLADAETLTIKRILDEDCLSLARNGLEFQVRLVETTLDEVLKHNHLVVLEKAPWADRHLGRIATTANGKARFGRTVRFAQSVPGPGDCYLCGCPCMPDMKGRDDRVCYDHERSTKVLDRGELPAEQF